MRMNRFCFLWIIGMLMGAIGMVSCSDDDDEIEYVYESSPTTLDGSWHLISASYGIQGVQDYKAGEITLTFDDANKTLKVENRKKISFLDSGTYRYRTTTEKSASTPMMKKKWSIRSSSSKCLAKMRSNTPTTSVTGCWFLTVALPLTGQGIISKRFYTRA